MGDSWKTVSATRRPGRPRTAGNAYAPGSRLSVCVDPLDHDTLTRLATEQRCSVSSLAREFLADALKNRQNP